MEILARFYFRSGIGRYKVWFVDNSVTTTDWTVQSSDLISIENLWEVLADALCAK